MTMTTVLQQKFVALQQDLGNGKWREIIAPYMKPDTKKAIRQIVNTFGPFLGIWVLAYFSTRWTFWVTIPLAVINGLFLLRIFVIQHDCGHQSFFGIKNKHANNAVGMICSLFSTIPYKYWARAHNFHHAHNGELDERNIGDINFWTVEEYQKQPWWRKAGYAIFRSAPVMFLFAPIVYILFSNRLRLINFKGMNWKLKFSQLRNNLIIVSFYVSLALLVGWLQFLVIQGTIVFVFAVIAFWLFYIQHQHEEMYNQRKQDWDFLAASILGSTYYRLPRMFNWLTGSIGVHHIHHLASAIPNYNLQKCRREQPILSKYVTEIGVRDSLRCIWVKLWDERQEKMIGWRAYRKMYGNQK